MIDDNIYNHSGPYWFYTDNDGTCSDGGGNDHLIRTIKAIAGTILMFIIGLALCSLLPSCSSTRKVTGTETVTTAKAEETSKTKETSDSATVRHVSTTGHQTEETNESAEDWYTTHIEKTTWSEPDSLGRQHKISTETWDKSGGTRKTRQDTNTSSQAVDLADSTSLSRGQTTRTKTKTDTSTKTIAKSTEESEGTGTTAARNVASIIVWVLIAAAACLLIWRSRSKISCWIWKTLLRLKA